jgi:hypothetical protein
MHRPHRSRSWAADPRTTSLRAAHGDVRHSMGTFVTPGAFFTPVANVKSHIRSAQTAAPDRPVPPDGTRSMIASRLATPAGAVPRRNNLSTGNPLQARQMHLITQPSGPGRAVRFGTYTSAMTTNMSVPMRTIPNPSATATAPQSTAARFGGAL